MKWVVAAGLVCFVGAAVWQYLNEVVSTARRADRRREPWEMV